MVGSLLLKRAGVTVLAGAHRIDSTVAATSTLYWAWRRQARPTMDLSGGWGSASQWATSFRRDYVLGAELHYNVDAGPHPGGHRTHGDPQVERELLRYRHGLRTDHGSNEWPWDATHVEPRT